MHALRNILVLAVIVVLARAVWGAAGLWLSPLLAIGLIVWLVMSNDGGLGT